MAASEIGVEDDGTRQLGVEQLVLRTAVEVVMELVLREDRLDRLIAQEDGGEPMGKGLGKLFGELLL